MYDYTHFLYNHKTSFKDFKILQEKENQHIYYYETKIFNWLPWSPIRKFISIKKLITEKKMFHQIYLDLGSKQTYFFKVFMKNDNDNCEITNELSIPVSNFLYFFKKPLLWIVNKKLDAMWEEDKELLVTQYNNPDYENIQCVPNYYNLENIFNKEFEKHFEEEEKIDFFTSA